MTATQERSGVLRLDLRLQGAVIHSTCAEEEEDKQQGLVPGKALVMVPNQLCCWSMAPGVILAPGLL